MTLGTGHYLCERREVKRMGGGGGRAGEVKSILEWSEGPIFYHSNNVAVTNLLPDILYRIFMFM